MINTKAQKGSYQDYLDGKTAGKLFHFRLLRKNNSTTITKSDGSRIEYVGRHTISAFNIITEKDKTGRLVQRTIRYIPGETSIYLDEQTSDRDVPKKKYSVEFLAGHKTVSGDEPLLLEWMMKSNFNDTNPNRRKDVKPLFELIDTAKIIDKVMENSKNESDALSFAFTGDWDEVLGYARVLGVNLNQSPQEVRYHLSQIAKRTPNNPDGPEKFLAGKNNPVNKKKYNVLKAIDSGYLVINHANNSISWGNNLLDPLYTAAMGKDVVDGFVNLLATDTGKLIYDAIIDMNQPYASQQAELKIPSKDSLEDLKSTVDPKTPVLHDLEQSDVELMDMIDLAKEAGLVTFSPPYWYKYKGDSFGKKEGFLNGLKNNPAMYKSFKYELSKLK